jgi:vitamin B12 transporter
MMMTRTLIPAVLCTLSLSLSLESIAAAEELPDSTGVYSLGEIVVSGKGEGVQGTEAVHTVTAQEIRDRDARTLDQAIALLPGVNVRTGAEGVPRIDIRGFRTRHVLLLLDGIPVNSAFDQQFDPTLIPTENIAEIKLTPGPSSVLYGQGGLGGVINIITKKGTSGIHGSIADEVGDHAPYLTRATVSGTSGAFDFFLSGSASQVDGFPLSDGFHATAEQPGGYRKNSDRERKNLLGTIGYTPTKDLVLGLTLTYTDASYGKPGSSINDPFDPFASPPKYARVNDLTGVSVQLAADYAATDRLTVRGWGFINHRDEHDLQFDNASLSSTTLAAGSFNERVETSIKGITLQPSYNFGDAGKITLSLSAEGDSWQNHGPLTLAPGSFQQLSVDKSLSLYSAGVEYEITPLPGLGLVAGYGHYWQSRSERDEDDYSVLAGASYDLFKETRLKASFKRNVRFPSLGDLYDVSQGNRYLAAERSFTYQAGVEQQLPLQSRLEVTGFYTEADNLIQNDQTVGRNMNLSKVKFSGVELAASTRIVDKLLLRGSYSYLHSKDLSRAGRDEQQYTPGNKLTLETKYDFANGFTPYASLVYVGDQYFYTKNNVTPVQRAKLNDYALVNVKLAQTLLAGKLTVYVGANNLFDENYETSYGFPQAGRFVYGGFEVRL